MSLVRQNYPEDCEASLNKHINLSLHASYVYLSMAYHFDRDDVALKGFSEYFKVNVFLWNYNYFPTNTSSALFQKGVISGDSGGCSF